MMSILLIFLFLACQKYSDPSSGPTTTNASSKFMFKSSIGYLSTNKDTLKIPQNTVVKFYNDTLPTGAVCVWNFGDNSAVVTSTKPEHKFVAGTYQITETITYPANPTHPIVNTIWAKASLLYGQDNVIRLLSATAVTGGYSCKIGFLSSTVYKYAKPPYVTNTPFLTGDFCGWKNDSPFADADVQTIDGQIYLVKTLTFPDNSYQELDFYQGNNWSYEPTSIFWIPTGTNSGKYGFYLVGGALYNFPPKAGIPGEDGDVAGGNFAPTVRDSLMSGVSKHDSLRIFVNWQSYASGSKPFLSYTKAKNWQSAPLKIILGTGWGYYTLSTADILADNGALYFKFGPDYNSLSVYGVMDKSVYWISTSSMLGIQLVLVKDGVYSVRTL